MTLQIFPIKSKNSTRMILAYSHFFPTDINIAPASLSWHPLQKKRATTIIKTIMILQHNTTGSEGQGKEEIMIGKVSPDIIHK